MEIMKTPEHIQKLNVLYQNNEIHKQNCSECGMSFTVLIFQRHRMPACVQKRLGTKS